MMIVAILVAAAPAAAAPQPSKAFVQGCYERAQTQAESNFCTAGEQESKKHEVMDSIETACLDRDPSQQWMNRCAGEAYERADKALNAQWKKALDSYGDDAESKKLLLDAQRAWLKYRDAHCEAEAFDSRGGSIWPMLISGCKADLTRQRTQELKVMLEGERQ